MNSAYARMPFGKHAGKLISDIPSSYLRWVLSEVADLEMYLRSAIAAELAGRDRGNRGARSRDREDVSPDPRRGNLPVAWAAVVARWHRELVTQFHPDKGGSTETMQALNHAADRLRELFTSEFGA